MILGFNPIFVHPILQGTKIHTIREDKTNRWKAGNSIQFATGVRTKNYHEFDTDTCKSVQEIFINPDTQCIQIRCYSWKFIWDEKKIEIIAKNDGFQNSEDFWAWFNKPFSGKIIHWTDFKY